MQLNGRLFSPSNQRSKPIPLHWPFRSFCSKQQIRLIRKCLCNSNSPTNQSVICLRQIAEALLNRSKSWHFYMCVPVCTFATWAREAPATTFLKKNKNKKKACVLTAPFGHITRSQRECFLAENRVTGEMKSLLRCFPPMLTHTNTLQTQYRPCYIISDYLCFIIPTGCSYFPLWMCPCVRRV